jgi:hypothetical protein
MPEDLPVTKRIDVMVGITRRKEFFDNSDEGELSSNGLFQVGVHNYQLVLNVCARGFQGFDAYPLLKWAVILLCCNLIQFGGFLMARGTPKWMV